MNRSENYQHDKSRLARRYQKPHQRRPSLHEEATPVRVASRNRRSLIGIFLTVVLVAGTFFVWSSDTPVYGLYLDDISALVVGNDKASKSDKKKSSSKKSEKASSSGSSEFDKYVTTKNETGREHWTHIAKEALSYYGVSQDWYTTILAMIEVESNGNVAIDVREDIMQAWEGDGKKIIAQGVSSQGIRGYSPEASIYAGCYELSLCIKDYKDAFGRDPRPTDTDDIGLLAQGYNYGHKGWFNWCKRNGVTSWSLSASKSYQSTIGGIGTANHGGKVQKAYAKFA